MKETTDIAIGKSIYELLVNSKHDDTDIIVCPADHLGDALLIASLVGEYKKQHGSKRVILVHNDVVSDEILEMFEDLDASFGISNSEMIALSVYIYTNELWYSNGIRCAHFRGIVTDVSIKFYNFEKSGFKEDRMNMLGLSGDVTFNTMRVPVPENDRELKKEYEKAVLLMPGAKSVSKIPSGFWKNIADSLKEKGFDVYTNYNGLNCEEMIPGTKPLSSSVAELAQLTGYIHLFVGLRSGACDLISLTGSGRLVIVYPEDTNEEKSIELDTSDLVNNIYELGRTKDIWCYKYVEELSDELITQIEEHA